MKARILSIPKAIHAAGNLHIRSKEILHQLDTYYCVPHGRLKLRIIDNKKAEMIYYNRPNRKDRKYSDYNVVPVSNPKLLNEICTAALSRKIVVDKKRLIFLYKNARIHLDKVRGLGAFIEFEVLVKYGKPQAQILMKFLSEHFNIKRSDMVPVSYSDLLIKAGNKRKRKQW